ncbi:DUF3386 domain-containing protein [Synechococcus sp. CS-602]|uniref:DUF3386 domain-containing protein n=1 Tax=Synechococcaceae TaxID=1890426 RepID=UPI0008FF7718|nr:MULTISPECIES: DUF3386 domain-containing protein [Synechococcaceae]MCT4365649.1 DUF3386 domain-containing protein [Candidatus Regnicoccus frigidus MAG-AL1]APD47366.1 hypothetical protein BM449_02480 [Synechococcus sp. SynAce01]MCT0202717.1 DUF3386 domain-containing protein [Synechococcus sp. CS-603]MCT0203633.1 DUF3386 domain-containing protein [Synechococcus sp. CS-602]MCT0246073.1 DUF3386 domain-containing protein [Synechococcus sp. CS-601]
MTISAPASTAPGTDLRELFQAAYQNRYTWEPGFGGYAGRCVWEQEGQRAEGRFMVGADLKANVEGIDDETISKAVGSQLWEVCIHRVRRSFEQTHGANTFTAGDTNEVGVEVIVGGKNSGDRYRIANDVVTMVHRHIHGTVVTIYTGSTTDTGAGYLSHTYSSLYTDPASGAAKGGKSSFTDTFVPLGGQGPWVLSERVIATEAFSGADGESQPASRQTFRFEELTAH